MAAWKQLFLALVILVAAAAGWAYFYPGAPDVLARWGIDWTPASARGTDEPAQARGERRGPGGGGRPQMAVITAPVERATINDRLTAIGTGRANQAVIVNPFSAGRLTEVLVQSGAAVEAGTVIARLDSEAEEIAHDRAKIAVEDAEERLQRQKALRASNTATAVQVTEAELALQNARLALRDAELALERRSIRAPISGIVGILPVNAGNYVTNQTAIATIDDRSRILVDFWVPERYASAISVGDELTATSIARPKEQFRGTVSAVDNQIDPESRTLQVQAGIDNPDDTLRAGMSFRVSMRFPGDGYPAVDPLAVQWGTDGAFVWAIQDGKARRTPVRIVQRNTESVLVEAELNIGDQVVIEGLHTVREGADLLIAGADRLSAPASPPAPATGG